MNGATRLVLARCVTSATKRSPSLALLRGITGLSPARAGQVILNGDDITRPSADAIARRGVRLVPQGRRLFPSLDVREHLVVGARRTAGAGWDMPRVLALFPRLRERLHHRGATLSGGGRACWPAGARSSATPTSC